MVTARLEKVERDFLTCVICLEHYTDPITLDCQHSFCRQCISDYIKTRAEARAKNLISCPCCSQMSRVPDTTRPVEEREGQLKPGFVMQGLIDTLATEDGQEVSTATSCSVCHKLGETTPGVMWCPECESTLCDKCVKMHRDQTATHQHILVDLDQKGNVKRSRKVLCKEHKDEQIKLYCNDCDKSLCHLCAAVYHRKCESVVTIQSMMPKIKTDITEHRKKLSEKESLEEVNTEARKSSITQLQKDKHTTEEEIRNASERSIEQIKQKEKQLIDELYSVTDKQITQIQAEMKKGDIEKQTCRQCGEYIDQALASDCEMDIYDLFQTWKSGCLDSAHDSSTGQRERKIASIRFNKSTQNIDRVLVDLNLGEIVSSYRVCDPMSIPMLYSTTDARTETDEKDPYLLDVTVLVVDGVRTTVVTDHSNKCVKSFYTKHGQVCHRRLPLDNTPFCITKFKENKVMVAVKWAHKIVTIEVNPELVLLSAIGTRQVYESLAVLDPTTLAAGRSTDVVDILNMEGQVMKSVSFHNNVKLFHYPEYMCVNKREMLLVSDRSKKSVTCLTSEGSVVWIYPTSADKKLQDNRGITTTNQGDILVTDTSANKVIQLSESGQYVRDILTSKNGLRSPYSSCVNIDGSLFVCDGGKIKEFVFK